MEERPRVKKSTKAMISYMTLALTMPLTGFAVNADTTTTAAAQKTTATTEQTATDSDAVMEVGRVYTSETEQKGIDATTIAAPETTAPAVSVTTTAAPEETTTTAEPTTSDVPTVTVQSTTNVPGAADWLDAAQGEWYNTKGELTMVITPNAINNCPITALTDATYDYPRTGTFTVTEATGPKTIKLDLLGHKSHQYLIINDRTPLRRSIHGDHYETVGSLYLGMTKDDVLAAYGQPAAVMPDQGTQRWSYTDHHVDVLIQGNLVMAVRLYKDSDLKFAQSGLGAADTPEAYAQAYGLTEVPTVPTEAGVVSKTYQLPQGERLHFAQDYVELSVF